MQRLRKLCSCLFAALFILTSSVSFAAGGENWDNGTIVATGMGVAPANAVNVAQARAMARRAAIVDAYRQMAETISGVNVTSESTVENFITQSDVTRTKVNAMIKGAKVIKEEMTKDGAYEVTMSVPMFGVTGSLASAVLEPPAQKEVFPEPVASVPATPVEALPTQATVNTTVTVNIPTVTTTPAPPAPSVTVPTPPASNGSSAAPAPKGKAVGGYTGLIVDCRGLGLQTAMSPVIKNDGGSPIYGYKNLDSDKVVSLGMAGYAKDFNNCQRAGSNPLIVKAVRVEGNCHCNPVITTADANRVLIENGASKFLDNTNVVFVRD